MTPKTKKPAPETLILDREAPVLREKANEVPVDKIASSEIKKTISQMRSALYGEDDGVAIAAPQIGVGLRIFLVRGSILKGDVEESLGTAEDLVFINPEIVKTSKKTRPMEEGCLSVRWLYGEVKRYEKITITAYDERGVQSEYGATGLLAQIFQHEIDHLEGILFIDKAENVRDLPPGETDGK